MGKILSNRMVEENFNESKNFHKQSNIFVYDHFLSLKFNALSTENWLPALFGNVFSLWMRDSRLRTYSGQQQNWPTSPGTFVNTTYVVPTYFGYPPRPYNVIGYLDATTAPIRHRGAVAFAARRAKELGADAIIVLSHGTEYAISTSSAFTSGQFYGSGFSATTTGTEFSGPVVFVRRQSS
jgi:hypothetical protein